MLKITSNNIHSLPDPNTDKKIEGQGKHAENSHKMKMVAGGIIGTLGLVLAGVFAYPHIMNQWNNFTIISKNNGTSTLTNTVLLQNPHVVPTFYDKFLQEAIIEAEQAEQTSHKNLHHYLEHLGHHYERLNNYTGAKESFTKCIEKDASRAKTCQSSLNVLEGNKDTYTTKDLNEALASIKQNLGSASPYLIKTVAKAEKNRDGIKEEQSNNDWLMAGWACEAEDKIEQAEYWYKLCANHGGGLANACKGSISLLKKRQNDKAELAARKKEVQVSDATLEWLTLKAQSGNEEDIFNLAVAYHDREEYSKAFDTYEICSKKRSFRCFMGLTDLSSHYPDKREEITKAFKQAFPNTRLQPGRL